MAVGYMILGFVWPHWHSSYVLFSPFRLLIQGVWVQVLRVSGVEFFVKVACYVFLFYASLISPPFLLSCSLHVSKAGFG